MPADLDAMINEMQIEILGGEEWLSRAASGDIRRTPVEIERRAARLDVQRDILELLLRGREKQRARLAAEQGEG